MLAKITSPQSLYNVLAYNMRKLHAGEASVLSSSRLPLEALEDAIQERVLQPLRAYHQIMQVRAEDSERTVFALEQLSLSQDKQLEITLYERNGGRTLSFYLEQEDLLLVRKIDNLKLKW